MGKETGIAWTNHTFNPWWGCQRVSPGCEHCYAETFSKRVGLKIWGPEAAGTPRRFFGDKHWREPLTWNAAAIKAGVRTRVFCASMADVFEDRRDLDAPRAQLHKLIQNTVGLDWLLLTKRPQNAQRLMEEAAYAVATVGMESGVTVWPHNVWLGITAEDQQRADERTPIMLGIDGPVTRFVSYEPAIGPVDFTNIGGRNALSSDRDGYSHGRTIDWIIIGGESGHGARPFALAWARSTIAQCKAEGVKVFFKQAGGHPTDCASDVLRRKDPSQRIVLRDRKGGDLSELPEDLRVREFPA